MSTSVGRFTKRDTENIPLDVGGGAKVEQIAERSVTTCGKWFRAVRKTLPTVPRGTKGEMDASGEGR